MDPTLQHHRPSERTRAQAEAHGIDLMVLKLEDPARYKMMNAERVLLVHPALRELASGVFFAAFRHYQLFELPAQAGQTALLSFPPLESTEFARLDDAFARLAALPANRERHAYYRIVSDREGERRQLGLPLAPTDWQGEAGVLVGPFPDQAAAEAWLETHPTPESGLVGDVVPQGDAWFVDLFDGTV